MVAPSARRCWVRLGAHRRSPPPHRSCHRCPASGRQRWLAVRVATRRHQGRGHRRAVRAGKKIVSAGGYFGLILEQEGPHHVTRMTPSSRRVSRHDIDHEEVLYAICIGRRRNPSRGNDIRWTKSYRDRATHRLRSRMETVRRPDPRTPTASSSPTPSRRLPARCWDWDGWTPQGLRSTGITSQAPKPPTPRPSETRDTPEHLRFQLSGSLQS